MPCALSVALSTAASHVQVLYPTIKASVVSAMKPRWWPTHEILGTSTETGRIMLERDVEMRFVARAKKELGLRTAKLKAIANAGWMDRLIPLKNGLSVYIEFKAPGREKNTSKHQEDVLAYLAACGVPTLVTSSAEDAVNFCIKHGLRTVSPV